MQNALDSLPLIHDSDISDPDFVHVHQCMENRKGEKSDLAATTTEFILNIFEDTPFAVKLLDASDFK